MQTVHRTVARVKCAELAKSYKERRKKKKGDSIRKTLHAWQHFAMSAFEKRLLFGNHAIVIVAVNNDE